MNAEAALLVRTFKVGHRTVTITCPNPKSGTHRSATVEWDPDVPQDLNRHEMRQYRKGRDSFMAEVANLIEGDVTIVET